MSNTAAKVFAFREIFERYVDDASFLWLLRSIAVKQPHYDQQDLNELEGRINQQLNGLYISPDDVWTVCESALALEEPGEVFTAAMVAFRSLDALKIQQVVEVGVSSVENLKGLASALVWMPGKLSDPWLQRFIRSKDLEHKFLAILVCSLQRRDPGELLLSMLQREDCLQHTDLHARCLRLIGELKRSDLMPALNSAMDAEEGAIKFWSRWSAILLGNKAVVGDLLDYINPDDSLCDKAIQLFFRAAPHDQAKAAISSLAGQPETVRFAIKGAAALGDPQVIPWLINVMDQPEYARVAGEAFTQITGIDLEANKLDLEVPDLPDLEDEDVELDDDENLAWPNVEKLKVLWQKYHKTFAPGQRYLLGKKIDVFHLKEVLRTGFQRHRAAASLELSIADRGLKLISVKQLVSAHE
ncbi:hypothetical protein TDB9533_03531 [Thalassocella blandensis]|nr:hypothetical protein TDB9533_03531 [Thalassocella blandensis]